MAMSGTRLAGKVALITGGGAGIGAATARIFCAEGASVLLVDHDAAALARTAAAIETAQPVAAVRCFEADVADDRRIQQAVAAVLDAFGRLDVLVNNAAMRVPVALADATPEQWQAIVGVNLIGAATCARAALPALRRAGRGAIVNVASCYALTGRSNMGLYDATKAGLLALTRTLAHEEAAHGIRANAVCPGSTLTDFHLERARAAGIPPDVLAQQRHDTSLMRRWAAPEEIAWPILWLASDEASFVTGATLAVDGGLTIV